MGSSRNQRSISVSGRTYARLRQHCDSKGIPMGQLVEKLIADRIAVELQIKAAAEQR